MQASAYFPLTLTISCLLFSATVLVEGDEEKKDPGNQDPNAPQETTTIRTEGPGLKAAGPHLIDLKIKNNTPEADLKKDIDGGFFIYRKSLTWGEAAAACEGLGAHLAVLPTSEDAGKLVEAIKKASTGKDQIENPENFKKPEIMELGISRRYWIGLTDQIEQGTWLWTMLGTKLAYEDFWYPGQPSNSTPEHCGSLWNPGYYAEKENTHKFNNAPCTYKYYAICDPRSMEDLKRMIPED